MNSSFAVLLVIAALAFQNVSAQTYTVSNSRRYNRYSRPVVLISSGSGVRTYVTASDLETNTTPQLGEGHQNAAKVSLDVYYETECPDSMRFITRQLYPLHREMEDVLDINLIPYGKAHESYDAEKQRYDFRCQHGPSECYGNIVQSCAISLYPNTKDHLTFINCMENYPRPSQSGRRCARRLSLDWEKIDKCVRGDEGNRLMHELAQKTKNLNPKLYFVPWIVVDKVFTETNQRKSLRNFKGVVCDTYKGKHAACEV